MLLQLGDEDHADQTQERAGHYQPDLGLARHIPRSSPFVCFGYYFLCHSSYRPAKTGFLISWQGLFARRRAAAVFRLLGIFGMHGMSLPFDVGHGSILFKVLLPALGIP